MSRKTGQDVQDPVCRKQGTLLPLGGWDWRCFKAEAGCGCDCCIKRVDLEGYEGYIRCIKGVLGVTSVSQLGLIKDKDAFSSRSRKLKAEMAAVQTCRYFK